MVDAGAGRRLDGTWLARGELMRLLFLAPNVPSPRTGGGSLRMYHMLHFLGRRFDVDLVASAPAGVDEDARDLRANCREVELVPPSRGRLWRRVLRLGPYEKDPALAAAVRRRLASGMYGAVQIEKPAMVPYLPRHTRVPAVLDLWAYGSVGALRALRRERGLVRRARTLLQLVRSSVFDALCWPELAHILVVSEIDRKRCLRARPEGRVVVVPNGVDCERILPARPSESAPPVLVFSGDMGFAPNVDAALLLTTRVFPEVRRAYPDAVLRLVGRNPDRRILALRGEGVTVTGEVPDMLPHLQAAAVYAAPHFTGAGTRTKLLEAMAAGLPIVTTSIGIEGIEGGDGREVVVADDAAAIVAAILRLLSHAEERRRLGAAARRLAEDRYDWARCLAPLEKLYAGLLAVRASG